MDITPETPSDFPKSQIAPKRVVWVLSGAVIILASALAYTLLTRPVVAPTNEDQNSGQQDNSQPDQASGQAKLNNSYHSENYGFTFGYPDDFGFNTDFSQVQAATKAYIPPCDQTMVACAFYTGGGYTGTNFESAGVSINVLAGKNTETACTTFGDEASEVRTPTGSQTINGTEFAMGTGGGAATGHSDEVHSYRAFYNGTCYEINLRVGQTAIGNYPAGTVQPFDSTQVWSRLEQILNSFEFTKQSATTGWKTYTNQDYGFEVQLPSNSTIEAPLHTDANTTYIRAQNYVSQDVQALLSGEFYLEIFVANATRSCADEIGQAKTSVVDSITEYRGFGPEGGDAGGRRFAFCFNKDNRHFYIQTTENSKEGNIANKILDSFKFTN